MPPPVSVCVPLYNGTKYLGECLDSILAQSFQNFELIIVDDGSSDDSLDLAQQYAALDQRVRVYRNPANLGLVGNWNRCLELAQGEWIKFVFQDDRIAPQCLEHLLGQSRPDVPLTVCQRECLFDGVSAVARQNYEAMLTNFNPAKLFPGLTHVRAEGFCAAAVEHLAVNFVGEPTAVVFHRDAVRRFGRFNTDFIQLCDFEYWARIAAHTGFIFLAETLAGFRVHGESATARNEGGRYFRAATIDPLLLLYHYAYNPHFSLVRREARRLGVNLRRTVADRARQAARMAHRDAVDPLIADRAAQIEWQAIVSRHPRLEHSVYSGIYRVSDEFDRHIGWRLRKNPYRNYKTGVDKVPVVVIVDVEPDEFFTDRNRPLPWGGYEVVSELLGSLRPLLAASTGSHARYLWCLRMDPQVAETYGAADWALRRYERTIRDCQSQGDEVGIHTHAYRWDESCDSWVVDHGNQPWVDHCVVSSFAAYRHAFGEDCKSFRFGDGWMNNETMRLLEKLGTEFELTLEPGQEPHPAVFLDKPFTGCLPDLRGIPISPYHPDRLDFTRSNPLRQEGIRVIPLSAAPLDDGGARSGGNGENRRHFQTLNLGCEPEIFHHIISYILTVLDRPFLTLVTRSDIGIHPQLLRNLKANLSMILRHPLAKRFIFCSPREAIDRLAAEPNPTLASKARLAGWSL